MKTIDFEREVRSFCRQYAMLPKGETVLCAVSGGLDSMTLLHLFRKWEGEMGFSLCVAHFDHQLRCEDAKRDAMFVQEYCATYHIPFYLGSQNVQAEAERRKQGIEETARELRYAFLQSTADEIGAKKIATAHHADDNAETLLLHLTRGTALKGLTGIPPVRYNIVRPLLTVTRQDIEAYSAKENIPFVQDASNFDLQFTRNRIRHEVMPILQQLNPKVSKSMVGTMKSLRQDDVYLTARAIELFRTAKIENDAITIAKDCLSMTPPALAGRVVDMIGKHFGISLSRVHMEAVLSLAKEKAPSKRLSLPEKLQVETGYETLQFAFEREQISITGKTKICMDGVTDLGVLKLLCRRTSYLPVEERNPHCLYIRAEGIGDLYCRARKEGDGITLPSRSRKTIKKLMIEKKIPRMQRGYMPVLLNDDEIVAVFGIGTGKKYQPIAKQELYEISFEMQ